MISRAVGLVGFGGASEELDGCVEGACAIFFNAWYLPMHSFQSDSSRQAHSSRVSVAKGSLSPSQPNSSSEPTSPSSDWLLATSSRFRFREGGGSIGDLVVVMSSWMMVVSWRPFWDVVRVRALLTPVSGLPCL